MIYVYFYLIIYLNNIFLIKSQIFINIHIKFKILKVQGKKNIHIIITNSIFLYHEFRIENVFINIFNFDKLIF